jgi:diguanylate cyclase (GGDEF)-like protein
VEELEQEYRAERFREYAHISRNMAVAGAVLILALWIRDYAHNPGMAHTTVLLRVVMASAVLLYAATLCMRVSRPLALASGYFAVFMAEFGVLEIWGRLGAGYGAALPGYMYVYLLLPVVTLPLTFRETAFAFLLVPVVPNLQALLGMAPGFPVPAFNALIWPACGIALFANHQFDRLLRKLYVSQDELRKLASNDVLTGLANRRGFIHRGEQACALARRHGRDLSVLMLDLDHFKAVNDRFGHAAGDDVLRFVAATIGLQLRTTDICGRTGGEEFAVVLPETSLEEALNTAERIRHAIERAPIPTDEAKKPLRVTASIGVATFMESGETLEEVLSEADRALYEAKRDGRNRVCGSFYNSRAPAQAVIPR